MFQIHFLSYNNGGNSWLFPSLYVTG